MKIGRVLRALRYNKNNLLYEQQHSTIYEKHEQYKQITKSTVATWIDRCKNNIKSIDFSKYNQCPDAIVHPKNDLDNLLQYFYAIRYSIIAASPLLVIKSINNQPVTFSFNLSTEHQSVEGITIKGPDANNRIKLKTKIFLPVYKIIGIINRFIARDNEYQLIQRLIDKIESTITHELEHTFQYINKTNDSSDVYNLGELDDGEDFTKAIAFIMYFTQINELEAFFTQCFYEYTVSKRKSFTNVLISNILDHTDMEDIGQSYENGEMTFNELATELLPHQLFLIIWTVFVYGINRSEFAKLIIDNNIKNKFNLKLVDDNMVRLKKFILQFHNNNDLQEALIDYFIILSDEDANKLFSDLFSITENNSKAIKTIETNI